ncbi:hypothetical protein LEMLEM_LOCUS22439, partial [Lemmus lemmus]
ASCHSLCEFLKCVFHFLPWSRVYRISSFTGPQGSGFYSIASAGSRPLLSALFI